MSVDTRIVVEDGRMFIGRSQDCTPIAEYTKAMHKGGFVGSNEMRHAARIPNVIVEKYCNENGVSYEQFIADPVHIKRLVQDPDNSMFRIWKGNF